MTISLRAVQFTVAMTISIRFNAVSHILAAQSISVQHRITYCFSSAGDVLVVGIDDVDALVGVWSNHKLSTGL